ncbi:DUF4367 domain-containing protein [Candidatus Saccharibacteria bacterium]|nr:DUF4367 domain-containing protein [Candidatus Saccharibacteria bacterium]
MQKTDSNQTAKSARRQVMTSTTLNRRYVKKPVKTADISVPVKRSSRVKHFSPLMSEDEGIKVRAKQTIAQATPHPMQVSANARVRARKNVSTNASGLVSPMTAKQLKDQAIKKALVAAAQSDSQVAETQQKGKKGIKMHFGFGRVMLALSCAAVAVFAIVYFVNLNMPDISLRVAAMQTGIEASYPSYVPRDYALSDIMSENGKITLTFKSKTDNNNYVIIEERSSWDSNALLNNFVKDEYSENFSTIKEQGLTIYMDGSNATWVNGGVVYKLKASSNNLTKKQIKSIATSL